ncbi:unnamed protein product, partial [Discosporangium mesarthrocarpum]
WLQVGRVNGNLNLSRSIGDLKYKGNKSLPPEDQIISAQPDVQKVDIEEEDLFILIACDGVWDCMSSQEVCVCVCVSQGEKTVPIFVSLCLSVCL